MNVIKIIKRIKDSFSESIVLSEEQVLSFDQAVKYFNLFPCSYLKSKEILLSEMCIRNREYLSYNNIASYVNVNAVIGAHQIGTVERVSVRHQTLRIGHFAVSKQNNFSTRREDLRGTGVSLSMLAGIAVIAKECYKANTFCCDTQFISPNNLEQNIKFLSKIGAVPDNNFTISIDDIISKWMFRRAFSNQESQLNIESAFESHIEVS